MYLEIKPADKVSYVIEIVDRKIRSFLSFWHDLWPCDTFELLIRPKENKALFPAHRVTKINLMRAAAKIFFLQNV